MELSKVLTIEAGPKIRDPFAVEDCLIAETVEALREQVDKACGREVGTINAVCKAASKFLVSVSIRACKMWNE
jgi:hypothetical protein